MHVERLHASGCSFAHGLPSASLIAMHRCGRINDSINDSMAAAMRVALVGGGGGRIPSRPWHLLVAHPALGGAFIYCCIAYRLQRAPQRA